MSEVYDVIVLGAGITGSTISILLKKQGFKIALIEKTNVDVFKSGESLAPACRSYLARYGLRLDNNSSVDYYSSTSVWGSDEVITDDFIFNPFGNGLAIDKNRFEQSLVQQSQNEGTSIFLNSQVINFKYEKKHWTISIKCRQAKTSLKCHFLILATGRLSQFNPLESRRIYYDRLIALTTIVDERCFKDRARALYIESLPNGWFYTNSLPDHKRVLTIFTDGDLLDLPKLTFFKSHLSATQWWHHYQNDSLASINEVKTFDARTSWSDHPCGDTWLEVGDSCYTIDPLSGQGILKNFEMISYCVEFMESFITKKAGVQKSYYLFNQENFVKHQTGKKYVYGLEKRWLSSLFWGRRVTVDK